MVLTSDSLKYLLETLLKPGKEARARGAVAMLTQQIHSKRWNQSSAQNIAGQHGEYDGLCERHKKISCNTAKKEHWQKDDADTKRRDQRRDRDLRSPLKDCFTQWKALFEKALDILDRYRSIVHKN